MMDGSWYLLVFFLGHLVLIDDGLSSHACLSRSLEYNQRALAWGTRNRIAPKTDMGLRYSECRIDVSGMEYLDARDIGRQPTLEIRAKP